EVETTESIQITQQVKDKEPFTALILGVDVEDEGTTRSDTIIVATINPKTESMKMVSIPRDTLVYLPNGTVEKMNAAYSTGGANRARQMVGEFLDIDIDFYATLDFNGLMELVDAVDGITVDSNLAFTENNYADRKNPIQIEKGINNLDGAEALGYARMRKKDPRGDFGRQDRQKEVIVQILNKMTSFNSISNLPSILSAVQPHLKTNARSNDILAIAGNYMGTLNNVETLSLNGYDGREYFPHYGFSVYVWHPYEDSLKEVQQELKDHLEATEVEPSEIRSANEEDVAVPTDDSRSTDS
ncbi:MAG TPA: LCP family protein, partial [Atopostipes sp.]|nr:LCP family protein [Atopostipes sp.]